MTGSDKLIPSYRGAVEAWECDQMDHMNVQFYTTKASAGLSHLLNALGLDPARIRADAKSLRYKNLRIQYKAEMRLGGLMYGLSGIRAVEGQDIKGFFNLYNSQTNTLSCNQEFTLRYEDLLTGEFLDMPADVLQRARELAASHEDQYEPAPMKCAVMPTKPMQHMFETNRTAVDKWECDAYKNIEYRHVIGRFSDAASHIMSNVGITRTMQRARNLGSAALDYYVEFNAPVRMADSIVLKSGLLDRSTKTFVFGHHMVNCDTDEIVNNTTVLGCYFDMTARKAVTLPQEFQDVAAEKLLVNQF
jgi:acyl-CoA thioester hydrolase